MEKRVRAFQCLTAMIISTSMSAVFVKGQISTPCSTSMVASFTPCFNYITGSTNNGSSPTSDCCDSLRSLLNSNMDCVCLIITASVPIQLPINRTLALSLPRACNTAGVPIRCKASGSPLPAPGPTLLGPSPDSPAPTPESPLSPQVYKPAAQTPELPPEVAPSLAPAPPPAEADAPASPKVRPVLTPSGSVASSLSAQSVLVILMGLIVIHMCY